MNDLFDNLPPDDGDGDDDDNGDEDEPEGMAEEAHARNTDPWTSHEAARSIPPEKLRESQLAVYQCFCAAGAMHHERLVATYSTSRFTSGWPRQSESGLRTRTKELVTAGYLRNSGKVVLLPSKRRSIVWERAL